MEIKRAAYLISSPSVEKCPKPDRAEYAFIGRSNVGKSSLINMLCNNSKLAKTSGSPGKTQLINHYAIESTTSNQNKRMHWYLTDLPGYGYAKISQLQRRKWEKMIEDYSRKRTNLVNTFILIDGRHEVQKIDIEFINKLGDWELPFVIVFTKTDKEKPGGLKHNINSFFDAMLETWQFLPQYFISSALTKHGKQEILDFIDECNKTFMTHEKSI